MSTIVLPYTFSPNTSASSSEVNSNFQTIFNDYNGGISAANLATDSVTTSKITDGNVTAAKIATNSITVTQMAASMGAGTGGAGAWVSWTPTLGGITIGNGTLACFYIQIAKTVIAKFRFTFGSTSDVTATTTFTLPVTASSNFTAFDSVGTATFQDFESNLYLGSVYISSTTVAKMIAHAVNATYATQHEWTTTTPFDTAANDTFSALIVYEAA